MSTPTLPKGLIVRKVELLEVLLPLGYTKTDIAKVVSTDHRGHPTAHGYHTVNPKQGEWITEQIADRILSELGLGYLLGTDIPLYRLVPQKIC